MSKTKTKQSATRKSPQSLESKAILRRRLSEGGMILLVTLALFFLLALLTYNPNDPGSFTNGSGGPIQNAAGKGGAWFADFFLHLFGYLAFLIPIIFAYSGYLLYVERNIEHEHPKAFWAVKGLGLLMAVVGGAGLCSLHFFDPAIQPSYSSGGILGEFIISLIIDGLGLYGTTLILLALFLSGLTLFTGISWLRTMDKVGVWVIKSWGKLLEWYENFKDRKLEQKSVKESVVKRQEALKQEKVKRETRSPVKIEPKVMQPSTPPKAVQKAKQKPLFDDIPTGPMPVMELLDEPEPPKNHFSEEALEAMSRLVELKLKDFGVEAQVMEVHPGPVITRFEIELAPGVKVSKISNLAKDLARSLSTISVRVVEVIPGKTYVGIEIPNESREVVRLREVLACDEFEKSKSPLSMALGKDIAGNPIVVNMAKMPHLLVAGTTGSGKSVGVNAMIISMLYKATPEDLRLIMIDPKMLELSVYEGIPHLLCEVVTDMKDAANALRWSVGEMERRYRLMSAMGVRNLAGFNKKVQDAIKAGEPIKDPLWQPTDGLEEEPPTLEKLPSIVIVIDELADMMMIVGKKVEELIARIAQKARAAGIHLILATQRPSVDVITGLIKANIPSRIAFQVSSKIDSRTILDQMGAEQLLGMGDMLYLPGGSNIPTRIHGAFVDDDEVHRVVEDWKKRGEPEYLDEVISGTSEVPVPGIPGMDGADGDSEQDELFDQAVAIVTETRRASISGIQRRLKIGYNRAARMVEAMEAAGIVSEMGSNGAREVLAPPPPKD
ncbi:cell division protein FtsK [Kangiella profundi]|uniref:DNA translocase FtsK n=1 Tax=Kangiella profundi TaxID=1561924 RepID=A0A2K9AQK5_9GAMM|nr:DNA translocase FtsK [Kangiella profundi]AUD78703.1 cell division protein FtsK [Kangiella profundi]GGE90200.1 DNA translocase FtsK [Kangiella profundi]